LPRIDEWYKAGGKFDGAAGPFRSTWKPGEIALSPGAQLLSLPMPAGTSPADVSPFGCRDMAGNGREFTSNLQDPRDATVPVPEPKEGYSVWLLGQSFQQEQPYRFDNARIQVQSIPYGESSYDIGFRVVVVIDAPAEP
jgi:hypothetical protein